MNPDTLIRTSDGERFVKRQDGLYQMETTYMHTPHTWSHERLMSTGGFRLMTEEEEKTGIINFSPPFKFKNSGHEDDDEGC